MSAGELFVVIPGRVSQGVGDWERRVQAAGFGAVAFHGERAPLRGHTDLEQPQYGPLAEAAANYQRAVLRVARVSVAVLLVNNSADMPVQAAPGVPALFHGPIDDTTRAILHDLQTLRERQNRGGRPVLQVFALVEPNLIHPQTKQPHIGSSRSAAWSARTSHLHQLRQKSSRQPWIQIAPLPDTMATIVDTIGA